MDLDQSIVAGKPQIGLLLLQLGGPKTQQDIPAFLEELFADVLPLPGPLARPLARLIAKRRTPEVRPLYEEIGGGSPLLANTQAQADALQQAFLQHGKEAHVHIAMRYAPPRAQAALAALRALGPKVPWVAVPLYPQYSFATTRSSLDELYMHLSDAEAARLHVLEAYPAQKHYIEAVVQGIEASLARLSETEARECHLVFSAHGLPMSLVREGDPYPEHIAQSVEAVCAQLFARQQRSWPVTLSYQSRVGPVKWLSPSTEDTLKTLGAQKTKVVLVVPIAFVSEHIETLHELDIQLQETAREAGVATFRRAPTVSVSAPFIEGLRVAIEAVLAVGPKAPSAKSLRAARQRAARASASR